MRNRVGYSRDLRMNFDQYIVLTNPARFDIRADCRREVLKVKDENYNTYLDQGQILKGKCGPAATTNSEQPGHCTAYQGRPSSRPLLLLLLLLMLESSHLALVTTHFRSRWLSFSLQDSTVSASSSKRRGQAYLGRRLWEKASRRHWISGQNVDTEIGQAHNVPPTS